MFMKSGTIQYQMYEYTRKVETFTVKELRKHLIISNEKSTAKYNDILLHPDKYINGMKEEFDGLVMNDDEGNTFKFRPNMAFKRFVTDDKYLKLPKLEDLAMFIMRGYFSEAITAFLKVYCKKVDIGTYANKYPDKYKVFHSQLGHDLHQNYNLALKHMYPTTLI